MPESAEDRMRAVKPISRSRKYGLEKSVAQRDVDALMKGRHI